MPSKTPSLQAGAEGAADDRKRRKGVRGESVNRRIGAINAESGGRTASRKEPEAGDGGRSPGHCRGEPTRQRETAAEPGAIPPSQRTSAQRKWALGIGEVPSPCCRDCPAIGPPWHPGHKSRSSRENRRFIPSCTRFPPFPGPASPACRGEPAPESSYIRNPPAMQGPHSTGRQRDGGDSDSDLRQRQGNPTAIAEAEGATTIADRNSAFPAPDTQGLPPKPRLRIAGTPYGTHRW